MFIAEVTDDFYEFTAEDYYRILATKKQGNIDDNPILRVAMWKDEAVLTLHHFLKLQVLERNKYYLIGGHVNVLIDFGLGVVKFGTLN